MMKMVQTEGGKTDTLVFDAKSGRFYERNVQEVCEEEFCLVDSATGEPILLTKVTLIILCDRFL